MAYVLTDGEGKVIRYPYNDAALRLDNPNVSFPERMTETQLAEWNVFDVMPTPKPDFHALTHRLTEGPPARSDGEWRQVWAIEQMTDGEASAAYDEAMAALRAERDARLTASDWTQIADVPLTADQKAAWATYRQALRDLPKHTDNPLKPVWPSTPGSR